MVCELRIVVCELRVVVCVLWCASFTLRCASFALQWLLLLRLPRSMWNLPEPRPELASPALPGELVASGPPRESQLVDF